MTRSAPQSTIGLLHLICSLISGVFAIGALIAFPATAQVANGTPPAVISPLSSEPDQNRVNIATGKIRLDIPTLTIPAAPRLKLDALQNAMPYITARVSGGGGNYIESSVSVHFGQETSDGFSCLFDDVCTNRKGQGSVLDGDITNGGPYAVTQGGSGAVYTFDRLSFDTNVNGTRQTIHYASSVVYPDGETISYTYDTAPLGSRTIYRVTRISSSTGFHVQFSYQGSDPNLNAWLTVAQTVIYRTNAPATPIDQLSYSASGTITDHAGRVYACSGCDFRVGGQVELFSAAVTLPGEGSPTQSVSSAIFGIVTSVVRDGVTWNYAYTNYRAINSPEGYGYDKVTVTGPNGFNTAYNILAGSQQRPNQITSTVDALGRTTSYLYDPSQRLTRITSPEGNSTSIGYDKWGNIIAKTVLPKPGSGAAVLNESSAIDSAACALNQVLCYRIATYTDALGRVTNYSYDGAGRLIEQTDPADASGVRRKTYNSYGAGGYSPILVRICGTGAPCGSTSEIRTEYTYWNGTQLPLTETRVDVGRGISATTTYAYDPAGRALSVDGPLPGTDDAAYYRYDVAGRRTWEIERKGQIGLRGATRTTYRDSDDNAVIVEIGTLPDATNTALSVSERMDISYDSRRNVIRTIRASGAVIYAVLDKAFDDRGRADCETVRMNLAALPAASATAACSLGTTGAQGADRITKRVYDVASQLIKTQVAVGSAVAADDEANTYSANGKLATVTDGENNRTTFEYDGHDRLTKTRYPASAVGANTSSTTDFEQLTNDAVGNVTARRLRDGQVINMNFDNLNRIVTKTLPSPELAVKISYDVAGRVLSSTRGDGVAVYYVYDALGRTLAENQQWASMSFDNDAAGRRTRTTWSDGFFVTYDYDAAGQLTAIRESGAASGVGVLASYSYDGLGRRTAIMRGNGVGSSISYDAIGRLTGLTHDLAGTTNDVNWTYAYNPSTQLTNVTRSNDLYAWTGHYNVNRSYGTNGLNQLTSAGGTALGYDARGNLTSSGSTAYTYTVENRLNSLIGTMTAYYDTIGRLAEYDTSISTRFLYDNDRVTAELDNQGAVNPVKRRYIWGAGADELVAWYEGIGSATRRFPVQDERASIVAVSDSTGALVGINRYDEYGIPASTNIGRFQYTGQAFLAEAGLHHYKARAYSPTLGRFLQTDPIGYKDGINWYDYVDGDPVNRNDPAGKESGSIGLRSTLQLSAGDKSRPEELDSPVRAFARYLGGSGTTANYSFNRIDTSDVRVSKFPAVASRLAAGVPGTFNIRNASLGYQTTGFNNANTVGRITLNISGQLVIDKNGNFTFSGRLSANNDTFNMNPSDRNTDAELKTAIGRIVGGPTSKPFTIVFKGDRVIVQGGNLQKMQCTGSLIERTSCN